MVSPPNGGVPLLPNPGQPAPMKITEYDGGSVPNLASFYIFGIAPPSQLYIQRDDVLLLTVSSSIAPESVTFQVRMIEAYKSGSVGGQPDTPAKGTAAPTPATTIVSGSVTLQTNAAYGVVQQLVPLSEGFLLSVSAIAQNAGSRGVTFVRAQLLRAGSGVASTSAQLLADYATFRQAVSWPGGRVLSPNEGAGNLFAVTLANPAAGADWTVTIPTFCRRRVAAVVAQLVTNATVASRIPEIRVQSGSVLEYVGTPTLAVPASTTAQVCGSPSVSTAIAGQVDVMIPLGQPLIMPGGSKLQSATLGLQAGDQWSNVTILFEEWLLLEQSA